MIGLFCFVAVLFVNQVALLLLCSRRKKRNITAISSELSSEPQRRNPFLIPNKNSAAASTLTAAAPSENDPSGFAMSEQVRKHKKAKLPQQHQRRTKKNVPNTVDEDWALGVSKPLPVPTVQPNVPATKVPKVEIKRPKLHYESNRRDPDIRQSKSQKPRWEQSNQQDFHQEMQDDETQYGNYVCDSKRYFSTTTEEQ